MPGLGPILNKEEITLAKQMREPDRGQESKRSLREGRINSVVLGCSMQAKTLLQSRLVEASPYLHVDTIWSEEIYDRNVNKNDVSSIYLHFAY